MIKTAAVQMSARESKASNLDRALKFIDIAVANDASLVAFPELFAQRWFPCEISDRHFAAAEPVKGETVSVMRAASKKHGIVVVVPFFEKYGRRYYNSCAVLDGGKLLGVYRKIHIPAIPLWEENYYFTPGNDVPVFRSSVGPVGVQICWDNFYWEGYRLLALKGAQLVVTPTASAFSTQRRWKTVIATHALLNNLFILRVNRTGREKMQEFYGNSFLVGPDGILEHEAAGAAEGIYFAKAELAEVRRVRKIFPFLAGRRPDLYGPIAGEDGDE